MTTCVSCQYNKFMNDLRYPKPKKSKRLNEYILIRVEVTEKNGFEEAAALAEVSLSSWMRERLRLAAIRELEGAGRRLPFVPEIPLGGLDERN